MKSVEKPLLVGAYWYPWYGADGRHWREGYRGTPLLGEYDSGDVDVIDQHVAWATEYGVDFFVSSWWGRGAFSDDVMHLSVPESSKAQDFQFAILYESPGLLGVDNGKIRVDDPEKHAKLVADFVYLAETYFTQPTYLRVDNRPVVFLYLTRIFSGDVNAALDAVRATVLDRTGQALFIVGDEVYWQSPTRLRLSYFDAVTAYNMHTSVLGIDEGFAGKVAKQYEAWAYAANRYGATFVPDVLPGFDDTAVRPEAEHPPIPRSPELFEAQLRDAISLADGEVRMVMITSWNEWHEDTSIEPAEEFGFDYLERLRDVRSEAEK